MATSVFDAKIFNPQVFGRYMDTIPRTKLNELLQSGVLRPRPDFAGMFPEQAGGNYAILPVSGRIGGDPALYDGVQNMPVNGLETFLRGIVAIGFMNGWQEKDFTMSVTGKDFMEEIAKQVSDYWDDFDQKTLLAILQGVFSMTGADCQPFIASHVTDLSNQAGDKAFFNETTVNTATQKAGGDNKYNFSLVAMHSYVATNLENRNLLERLKYTDGDGIQRDLTLGTLNGKTVIIDDDLVTADGKYITYLLGTGAVDYASLPVKAPYEVVRDAKTNGGIDQLLTRQRKVFAPFGMHFTMAEHGEPVPHFSRAGDGSQLADCTEQRKDCHH
jgi:hypothetical protein